MQPEQDSAPVSVPSDTPRITSANLRRRPLVSTAVLVAGAAAGAILVIAFALALTNRADSWWSVLALGVIEGITEFMPISSTAHLLVAADLLRFQNSIGGTFEIFIQLGAVLAVLAFFAGDLLAQARTVRTSEATRRFWLGIVIAFLPAALVGILLRGWIKSVLFASPGVIAAALIIGGIVLIIVEQRPPQKRAIQSVQEITLRQALGIGIAQVLALVPGVSRSAASIVGGMLLGLDRKTATAFSFYLAIPTLGAATVVDLLSSLSEIKPDDIGRLLLGTSVSFIVAWVSIGWLLRYVANHSFVVFGIYRVVAGIVILALVGLGQL